MSISALYTILLDDFCFCTSTILIFIGVYSIFSCLFTDVPKCYGKYGFIPVPLRPSAKIYKKPLQHICFPPYILMPSSVALGTFLASPPYLA